MKQSQGAGWQAQTWEDRAAGTRQSLGIYLTWDDAVQALASHAVTDWDLMRQTRGYDCPPWLTTEELGLATGRIYTWGFKGYPQQVAMADPDQHAWDAAKAKGKEWVAARTPVEIAAHYILGGQSVLETPAHEDAVTVLADWIIPA